MSLQNWGGSRRGSGETRAGKYLVNQAGESRRGGAVPRRRPGANVARKYLANHR